MRRGDYVQTAGGAMAYFVGQRGRSEWFAYSIPDFERMCRLFDRIAA